MSSYRSVEPRAVLVSRVPSPAPVAVVAIRAAGMGARLPRAVRKPMAVCRSCGSRSSTSTCKYSGRPPTNSSVFCMGETSRARHSNAWKRTEYSWTVDRKGEASQLRKARTAHCWTEAKATQLGEAIPRWHALVLFQGIVSRL
jgi:hypothetical protein